MPPAYAPNPLQLCSVFPELGRGHRQNSLHCSTLQRMLWEAWGVSASAYLKGHEIRVSLAVARSRAHPACTVPYCTAREIADFMVRGSLCSDFICDQPRTQRAVNMTEVRNPASKLKNLKPYFRWCCGCKCCNLKTQQCGAHFTAKPHTLVRRSLFWQKEENQQQGVQRFLLKEPAGAITPGALVGSFPASSPMGSRKRNQQLRRCILLLLIFY